MSDSSNNFSSMQPLLKDAYSDGTPEPRSVTYMNKMNKLMEKPTSSKKYFAHIKKYIKKAKNGTKS